jgi:hypothetical protein
MEEIDREEKTERGGRSKICTNLIPPPPFPAATRVREEIDREEET